MDAPLNWDQLTPPVSEERARFAFMHASLMRKRFTLGVTDKLSRRDKWLYGSGDLGFSLTNTILNVYFALFLTDVVGVKPAIAAVAIFVGSTWDYINDPIVGYISDRTHTRWGRRRPFLLFGALPFAVTFMLLWWKPPFESSVALAIYYSVVFALIRYCRNFRLHALLCPDARTDR